MSFLSFRDTDLKILMSTYNDIRTDNTVKAYNLSNIKNPLPLQADYYYQYKRKFIVISQ